jgi:hypothetical protein
MINNYQLKDSRFKLLFSNEFRRSLVVGLGRYSFFIFIIIQLHHSDFKFLVSCSLLIHYAHYYQTAQKNNHDK